jgi:hypothetical protein
MKLPITHVAVISILLVCFASVGAQQANESKIADLRATIEKLEGLSGDANIPVETRENLSELLFEKRGELHGLLRQQREGLRTQLQSATSSAEQASLSQRIRDLTQEMQKLTGASAASTKTGPAQPSISSGSTETGPTEGHPSLMTAPAPLATGTEGSANVTTSATPPSSVPTGAPPATAQPAADAQDPCTALLTAEPLPQLDFEREVDQASCRMLFSRTGRGTRQFAQIDFGTYTDVIALALAKSGIARNITVPEFTAEAENASQAKNVSASSSSSGSTALVSKAGLPAVWGFAVENGGLTKKIDGTTVTFTGNPVGIIETLAKKGFIESYQKQDDLTAFLRKLSFAVSFDTSRGDQPGVFAGDRQQLSGYSFKYNIVDQRDPRSSRWTKRWEALTNKEASDLALSINKFVKALRDQPVPAYESWLENARRNMAGKNTFFEIKSSLLAELGKLQDLPLTPDMEAKVKQIEVDFKALIKQRNAILDEISNGWIATFDYNNERPAGLPSLSNFRFLVEKGAYNGSIDFTGNASITMYNSRPTTPNTQRLRDFRFAAQIDRPFGDVTKTGKFLLSFAGRYQRLVNDEPIEGTTDVIKKGDIAVGQLKLTIPIRGTAFKIPLSISFANRTELIKEKEVRGNFGVTFDLDSILAKFNPFNKP